MLDLVEANNVSERFFSFSIEVLADELLQLFTKKNNETRMGLWIMERLGIPSDKYQEYWNSRLCLEKGSNFHKCSSQNSGTSPGTLLEIGVHIGKGGEYGKWRDRI